MEQENIFPVKFHWGDMYVVIDEFSEGGYYYDVYENEDDYEEGKDSEDGGLCTGSLSDAIEMALS